MFEEIFTEPRNAPYGRGKQWVRSIGTFLVTASLLALGYVLTTGLLPALLP